MCVICVAISDSDIEMRAKVVGRINYNYYVLLRGRLSAEVKPCELNYALPRKATATILNLQLYPEASVYCIVLCHVMKPED